MVALESAELFRHLRPDELKALRQVTLERRFAAGQEIFHEGDPGDGMYVVKEGSVEISGLLNQNTRRVFSQIGPGDVFGEMAVIEHRPRSASATAVGDTTVYFIPRGEMLSLIERSPGLALSLLQEISHRLREFNRQYLNEVVQAERLAVIGRFARSIVHDLKNPLTVIGLTAEIAGSPDATTEMRAQSQRPHPHSRWNASANWSSDILNFTQGSQAAVVLVAMDYAAFVRQVLAELRQEIELKSRAARTGRRATRRRCFCSTRNACVASSFNLVHNATDAMPRRRQDHFALRPDATRGRHRGRGHRTGHRAGNRWTGCFKTFATHGKEHGTGLGLSICKKIVEDHGGRIWARNEPGRGAIFSFAMPAPKRPITR